MVLSGAERQLLQTIWAKVSANDELGGEIFDRMFHVYPTTKTYFPHFNLGQGSGDVRTQGQKVLKALGNGLKHLDNLRGTFTDLADLHAYNLRVDPVNFKASRRSRLFPSARPTGRGRCPRSAGASVPRAVRRLTALSLFPPPLQLLAKTIHVALAIALRNEYTALAYLAFDKFLAEVGEVLCEKYR
ncbi:hypothetical protein lerEdw1_004604 [Lerista edwardsae]|nr:hypothetical protein lerEdw1_004604 [Lerista edwardsae]